MSMEKIIEPIDPRLIEQELTPERFLRNANNGGTQIYRFTAAEAPNAMQELGRLREEAFREAGGGTGKAADIDEFDVGPNSYQQLVVWDPGEKMILGGYRYSVPGHDGGAASMGATRELFEFSDRFVHEFLPKTIELGRSFVRVHYQSSAQRRKSLYVLDNLWDGLGALVVLYPGIDAFFGKVTMYPHYNREARNILHCFLQKYFPDPDRLVWPREPLDLGMDRERLDALFTGGGYKADFEILSAQLAQRGEKLPPLIKSYIGLSSTMRIFGTAINHTFGDVEETGILVRIPDIYPDKIQRHVDTYRTSRKS